MSTQLAVPQQQEITLHETFELGRVLAASGFFADAQDANKAVAKILLGREYGLGPMDSLVNLYVVKGKPTLSAGVIAAAIKASPKYDYEILHLDTTVCRIAFFEMGVEKGIVEFTAQDAKRVGTQNTDKWMRNMLFARCITDGRRFYCPDVFKANVYSFEEMDIAVDDTGEPLQQKEEVKSAVPEHPVLVTLSNDGNVTDITTDDLRGALEWIKNNEPKHQLKRAVVEELRERAKSAQTATETPAPTTTGELPVIDIEPEPSDAAAPPAEEPTGKKKASAKFIEFTTKCKTLFEQKQICDWNNRDARLAAVNAWLKDKGYAEVASTSDIPNGQLYNMLADLGVTLTW